MVLLKSTLTGIALLALGLLLLTYLGPYVTIEVQETRTHVIQPHEEFLVGDVASRPYSLPGSSDVFGSMNVNQAPSNQSGDIHFAVFDAQNYQVWNSGQQANFVYSADKQGQFNYTFKTDKSGTYYFVFDNRASVYKKYVVYNIAYNEIITSRVPDPRVSYLAWGLAVGGGLILVYGLMRKPPVTWN